jgi:hypothetical protein
VLKSFSPEALFYSGMVGFIKAATRFIGEGVRGGEDVLVAVSSEKIDRLRSALCDDDRVRFLDIEVVGRNPGRIIPAWKEFVSSRGRDDRRCVASASRCGRNGRPTSWWSHSTTSRC